jgi:hypothetical protein
MSDTPTGRFAGLPEVTHTSNPFFGLLGDAIALALASQSLDNAMSTTTPFARAAVAHCVFALEAAANACLERLQLSRALAVAAERLSLLDKFELIAKLLPARTIFDRGARQVQCMSDLIELRNSYVHPKQRRSTARRGEAPGDAHFEYFMDASVSTHLKWSRERLHWGRQEAKEAITATHAFLYYFFVSLCDMTEAECDHILADAIEEPDTRYTLGSPALNAYFAEARSTLGVDFTFLGLRLE